MFETFGGLLHRRPNLTVDWHAFAVHVDRVPDFAAELVKADVDVILASGSSNSRRTAGDAIDSDPRTTDDIVRSQLVNSLARPRAIQQYQHVLDRIDGKRQEILIEAVPGLRRMAAIADSSTTALSQLQALQDARARNVELSIHQIARPEEIAAAIDAARSGVRSVKCFWHHSPLRQSSNRHATRCGLRCGHLSISRSGAGRRLCRLCPRLVKIFGG